MLKIAVCDDEKIFRNNIAEILENYTESRGIVCEVRTYSSGREFVELGIEMLQYDVVFLDVQMDELDGLMTAKRIRENSRDIFIVFVTAFISYTLEGYKVDAVRYILKDKDNMLQGIYECMDAICEKMNYMVTWKQFEFNEGTKKVSLEKILYIESKLHKLEFHIMEECLKIYTLYDVLNKIEEELAGNFFLRIHQSYLVNMKFIEKIRRYEVWLNNGVRLDIPRARWKYVEEQYVSYKGEF